MQLAKFFAVFVVLIGRICLSKIIIETNNKDEFAELEIAAIRILENCYAIKDKTIAVIGDFLGNFIKKLSAHRNFSIVSLDDRRRAENNINYWKETNPKTMHKVHVLVTVAPLFFRFSAFVDTFMRSRYYTTMTSVLMLGWSPKMKNAGCDGSHRTFEFLHNANLNNLLYANLICRHRTEGIVIYGFNAFTNYAPKPWQLVASRKRVRWEKVFSYFVREYRDDDGMCENLFFDKTRDLNGWPIKITLECWKRKCSGKLKKSKFKNKRLYIQYENRLSYIRDFITYVNGTQMPVWQKFKVGYLQLIDDSNLFTAPTHMRGVQWDQSVTYPYGTDCKYLITQFRGHKSQLRKIYDIIDNDSWVGMWIVYVITLIFFKFFLHQSLIEGLLNICRLTCNFGINTSPRNLASRIYLSCLLCFVVTMQGIFTGNLASLLTHDIPVRQVNSIRDLVDLNYTVYADSHDIMQINDAGFKGRLITRVTLENCLPYIICDPLVACLSWGVEDENQAVNAKLHVSSDCVASEYLVNVLPRKWPLEEKINKFLLIKIGGGFMADLDVIVNEKRLLEADSEEEDPDPVIMSLADLGFAFIILGVGLACALISFIAEIYIYRRFQRRVTTTRVIVLN